MLVDFDFLYVAIVLILIGCVNNFLLRIIAAIIAIVILCFKYNKKQRIIAITIVLIFLLFSLPILDNNINKARIIQIKNNYYLANSGFKNIVIYSDEKLCFNDEVIIIGELSEINSYNNFQTSTFKSYCYGNNIVASVNKDGYQFAKNHFSIRKLIYQLNKKLNRRWINAMLFNDDKIFENDYSSLFFSCGLHLSSFLFLFKKIMQLFVHPTKSDLITNIVATILVLVMGPSYGLLRVALNGWLKYFIKDNRQALAILIIILCLWRPYYIFSLAFMIPIGLKIISYFYKRNDYITSKFYLYIVQSLFFGYCNLVQILLFNVIKYLTTTVFALAIAILPLPLKIDLSLLVEQLGRILDQMADIEINGKIPLLLFFLALILIFKNSYLKKNRYYFYYLLIIIAVCNIRSLACYYSVNFLDVGQGDCALITRPFSKRGLLIDCGGNYYKDIGSDIVIPYLKAMAIKDIDIILSHDDLDHCGGLESLINKYSVNQVINEKAVKYDIAGLNIYDLLYDKTYQDPNDNSLTCFMKLNRFTFLFTGDISAEVERDLCLKYDKLNVDILKVSHHGSKNSTSDFFLQTIKPHLAIISASSNNVYHHPDINTIERLNSYKINYLNTAKTGAIKAYIFNHLLIVITSDNQLIIQYR